MDNPPTLETDRLVLRPLCPGDAPGLHAVYAQPEAMRFWSPPGHEDVAETLTQIEKWIAGPGTFWALHPREGGGIVGIVYYIGNPGVPGMGYLLHPSRWGMGLMSEAVAAALAQGFGPMGLDRVELWIESRNLASRRLAERAGFTRRAAFPQKYPHDGAVREKLVYGLRREEWRPGEAAPPRATRPTRLMPVLAVWDVAATAAYYRDTLGFTVEFMVGDPPAYGGVAFREWTATGASLRFRRSKALPPRHSIWLRIEVGPDIDALYGAYRERGVEVERELASMDWGEREFAVRDCNGYLLEFCAPG